MTKDDELIDEINMHAQAAEEMRPYTMDRAALADLLAEQFPHKSRARINEQLGALWQKKMLFWSN